jgi:WD40 repeat protein
VGDFEEVVRLQAGLRSWLLRSARSGRHQLRDGGGSAMLPLLCAAAFGPALAGTGDGTAATAAGPRLGVLTSIGADALAGVLAEADRRTRSGEMSGDELGLSAQPDLSRRLEGEIGRGIAEALGARDERAAELRSDIAMVLREIDAGGTVFRAAIETGEVELEREVLAAFEALSSEFGDMAFMLADLARAAGEIQDSLSGQGAELRAASLQTGRQAADVRMIREELTVIEQRARQWQPEPAGAGEQGTRWAGCPYRGLLPYDQAHEALFGGRERLTAELAGKLAGTGIVMVTGASGAGKTSLLQAGLVPALARGVQVPGSSAWPVISLTVTARPLADLAAALAPLDGRDPAAIRDRLAAAPGEAHQLIREITAAAGDAARLVLIIDQFEQVFAVDGPDERRERAAFIDAVCAAATRPAGMRGEAPARVVIAVRGDHWDRCAAYSQLVRVMEHDQLVVGPMPQDALRRAIAGPAQASGVRVESALIDVIAADAHAAGPGAVLPLVSQALALTWENRDGEELTRAGYERAGRVARAVEAGAEAIYGGLPEKQQALTRDLLRRMTAAGQDGRPARRRISVAELHAGLPKGQRADASAVLGAFARGRLVMMDADTAELAHDVLLEAWPRLRGWLEEDQSSLVLYGQLAGDAARWRQDGKDSARLYRGVQLAAAREAARVWAADPGRYPALPAAETEFLRASNRAGTRGRWGRRTLAGALVLLLIAVLAGAGLAVRSARDSAARQRTESVSVRLAGQSAGLEAADPVTAALLAGAAWRIAPTAQARYSLLQSLAQPVRGILAAQAGAVTAVAAGPGGTTLAAGYRDGTIRLWDVATHHLISTATWKGAPLALAFTGGGKALAVAGPAAVGAWNLSDHATITARPLAEVPGQPPAEVAGRHPVAFSPDGATLATGGSDGNVRLWSVATRQELGAPMSSGLEAVQAVTFSADGTTLAAASSDGTVQLWDVATRQEAGTTMTAGPAAVGALAFTPDGKFLAAGDTDGDVRLWDVATHGQQGATMATGAPVRALSFSADGTTLATAEGDGSAELWAFATHQQTGATLAGPGSGGVSALAFGSGVLAAGGGNGTIELWDPARFRQSAAPVATGRVAAGGGRGPAAFSARGDVVAVGSAGRVRVWDVPAGRPAGPAIEVRQAVTGLAVSPDGKTLAVIADGLQLWSAATGQRIGSRLPAADAAGPVAFSPDGTVVAAIGTDGRARLWRGATQSPAGTAVSAGHQEALAFSPGGTTFATVGADGTASVWSVATGHRIGVPMTAGRPEAAAGQAASVAFSPDGRTLATAGPDGATRLWDTATQQEIGTPMTAGSAPVYALAFSPGGAMLATAGADGVTRLWDTATQQEIGPSMTAGSAPVYALAFSPGGATLATTASGATRRWDVAFPAGLPAAACAIAGQNLTPRQWAGYAGSEPYQQVCPAS